MWGRRGRSNQTKVRHGGGRGTGQVECQIERLIRPGSSGGRCYGGFLKNGQPGWVMVCPNYMWTTRSRDSSRPMRRIHPVLPVPRQALDPGEQAIARNRPLTSTKSPVLRNVRLFLHAHET